MKKAPLKQRLLFFAGILLLNVALWSRFITRTPSLEFVKGFCIGLGIVFIIAAFVKIIKLRHAAIRQ